MCVRGGGVKDLLKWYSKDSRLQVIIKRHSYSSDFRQVLYHISLFFLSSKFSSKKYSRKIIFTQTKIEQTSHVWWAIIEEIALPAEEMACYVRQKDIWAEPIGEVLVCGREPTNVEKFLL